jgi:ankyrin repeat protein
MLAVAAGESDALAALCAAGADLEAADADACTALAHAVRGGRAAAAEALRGLGARVGPCLAWAAANGRPDVVLAARRLDPDLDLGGSDGALALASAARAGRVDALQELCRLGARVGARLEGRCTALHWAAGAGRVAAAAALVSLGAGVEARDGQGRTALSWAAMNGHAEAAACLVADLGADVEARDSGGRTALMWAAKGGHAQAVERLCRKGAALDAADYKGATSLMKASRSGSLEAVLLLCDAGADVFARRDDGRRAVHCAEEHGRDSVAQRLRAVEAEMAGLVLRLTTTHARWACSLGASIGLSRYSPADTVALELAYGGHRQARKRLIGRSRLQRKCLVRVVPEDCPRSVSYTVDVATMQQQNMQSKFQRPVVRFFPPVSWLVRFCDSMAEQQLNHPRLVALVLYQEEYDMLVHLFQKAGQIRAIHRVQNPALFHSFQSRVNNLRAACGDDWDESGMVRWLFHGTSDENIDEIVKDPIFGFKAFLNKRASFGKGIYFANTASYSVSYCSPSDSAGGFRRMLVGAVALGRIAKGGKEVSSPPPGYHSLANSREDPDIFVIPDGASAYPAYVISFT